MLLLLPLLQLLLLHQARRLAVAVADAHLLRKLFIQLLTNSNKLTTSSSQIQTITAVNVRPTPAAPPARITLITARFILSASVPRIRLVQTIRISHPDRVPMPVRTCSLTKRFGRVAPPTVTSLAKPRSPTATSPPLNARIVLPVLRIPAGAGPARPDR